jgi:hypothetical protein
MAEELDDFELLRLYLDDLVDQHTGHVFFQDYQLQKLIDSTADLMGAASRGWRIKAARVAEWYNITVDGAEMTRSQAFRHAMEMARIYQNESAGELRSVKLDNEFVITESTTESDFA